MLIRLIAGVEQWDATSDVVSLLQNAQHKFDLHMKRFIGINPSLMMPGNYSRTLFNKKHEAVSLALLDEDDQKHMTNILNKFRFLRSVYRANQPDKSDVKIYKTVAVQMGQVLIDHFNLARWPNYLHKIIEDVQEILEDPNGPGSIGAFSSEGNKTGNKLFRLFRKSYLNRDDSYKGLENVIKLHRLYSSLTLEALAAVEHRRYRCSKCSQFKHNKNNCNTQNI